MVGLVPATAKPNREAGMADGARALADSVTRHLDERKTCQTDTFSATRYLDAANNLQSVVMLLRRMKGVAICAFLSLPLAEETKLGDSDAVAIDHHAKLSAPLSTILVVMRRDGDRSLRLLHLAFAFR